MTDNRQPVEAEAELRVANYAVSFIDLLGQRNALAGQACVPHFTSDADRISFMLSVRSSVGAVASLYARAKTMMKAASDQIARSPLRERLSSEQRIAWDAIFRAKLTEQRWSDGLMLFSSMAEPDNPCPPVTIFDLLTLSGSLCFLGLASRQPLRGGLEIAWGIELHPRELHGPAVVRAYELESEFAKYPRLVVGRHLVEYLRSSARSAGEDPLSQAYRGIAQRCLSILSEDEDGLIIVDYLSGAFRASVSNSNHDALYHAANLFISDQLTMHRASGNDELAERYARLQRYFDTCKDFRS